MVKKGEQVHQVVKLAESGILGEGSAGHELEEKLPRQRGEVNTREADGALQESSHGRGGFVTLCLVPQCSGGRRDAPSKI